MNRKVWVFAGLAVLLVGVPLASKLMRGDGAKAVEAAPVATQAIRSSILASGALAYRNEVQLRSEVIGKVASVPVEEGDRVTAGDVIVQIDPEQFRAQVEQQEASVRLQEIAIERQQLLIENLERQVQRKRDIYGRQLMDADSFETAENELSLAHLDLRSRGENLSQARATLAQARDNLDKTTIRTPIAGIVIKLDVKPGEAVITGTTNIPGSTLAVIADPSVMLTEVRVDEADIAKVSLGQAAAIFAAAFPDTALPGVVETIATSAEQQPGQQALSFEVKIRLTDPGLVAVRPGMSCRAEIYTESSEDAVAVPVQAIRYDEESEGDDAERPFVFVVENGKAVRRDIELGISSDSHTEVTSGLAVGETIVTGPFRILRHLQDGETVSVAEGAAADDLAD